MATATHAPAAVTGAAIGEAPTLAAMNELLWSNALGLRAQELTPAVANATATTVGTILRGVKLQLDYNRAMNRQSPIELLEA